MRSVMLSDMDRYIGNYTYLEYHGQFKPKESQYRNMWTEQGMGFWVKFVVCLKKYFKTHTSFYDLKYDSILISFLRALTHEDFNEVNLFLENAAKKHYEFSYTAMKKHPFARSIKVAGEFSTDEIEELKSVIITVSLASAFVLLLPTWRNARPGETIRFHPITEWLTDNFKEAEPFEYYLKTMLGSKPVSEIEKILGLMQLSLVRWWDCPPKNVPPLESKFVTEPCPVLDASQLKDADCLGMNFNTIFERFLMKDSEKNQLSRMPFDLPSILTFHYGCKIEKSKCKWQQESKMLVFKMFEYGFPPLLHPSYHRVEKSSLATVSKKFLFVLPCFAMNLETFDFTFLERMNEYKKDCCDAKKACNFNFFETFKQDSKEIIAAFNILSKNMGNYDVKSEDSNNLKAFLFEPCILMQLVCQPVLLRQWFSAALLAVLKLQIETVEFRHFPLPKDIEPLIRRILLVLSELKEVIMFGFWYIGSLDKDNKLIHRVVDEFVFAKLHDLEYICSDSAFIMVKTLKQKCFSERISLKSSVQLDPETYDSLSELPYYLFAHFYGNFVYWDPSDADSQMDLFPEFELDDKIIDLPCLVEVDRYELCSPRPRSFHINLKSSEEKKLYQIVVKCYRENSAEFSYMSNSQYVASIVKTIFAPCRHFSAAGCDKLVALFSSMHGMIQGLTTLNQDTGAVTNPVIQAALSGIQYRHIVAYLHSIRGKTGLLMAMNRQTADIAKKEQLVRIVAACTLILEEAPVICQNAQCPLSCCFNSNTSPMTLYTITKNIKTHKEKKTENFCKTTFWNSKFPKEWGKPVAKNVVMPPFSNIPAVITALEERIGRIIWNVAVRHNDVNFPGTEFFPDATIVHYILPCYISSLLEVDKLLNATEASTNNLISVLCALVKHYEESYNSWVNKSKLSNKWVDIVVARYNYEVSSYALHGFARLDAVDGKHIDALPHLKLMLKSLNSCSEIFESKPESYISLSRSGKGLDWLYKHKPALKLEHNVKTPTGVFLSRRIYTSHSTALRQVCFKTLPLSLQQTVYHPNLQEFYFTNMVLHQIMTVLAAQKGFCDNPESARFNSFFESFSKRKMPQLFFVLFAYGQDANTPLAAVFKDDNWQDQKQVLHMFFRTLASIRGNQNITVHNSFPDFECLEFKEIIKVFFDGTMKVLKLSSTNPSDNEVDISQPLQCPQLTEDSEASTDVETSSAFIYSTSGEVPITNENSSPHSCTEFNVVQPTEIPETTLDMEMTSTKTVSTTNHISSPHEPTDIKYIVAMPERLEAAAVENSETQQIDKKCTQTSEPAVKIFTGKQNTIASTTNIKVSGKSSNTTSKPTSSNPTSKVSQDAVKVCNNCGKKEQVRASFIPCMKCEEQKYPLPNFFCTKKCEKTWWESNHFDQHAEFQLGLFDFSSLLSRQK